MYYTIYKTTNKINNKIYIGKHQTKNLEDDYLGSGKHLKRAIQKYGLENFKKEILFIFETEVEMNNKEKELVTEEFCRDTTTYNICEGGKGGFGFINNNVDLSERNRNTNAKRDYSSEEFRKKVSESQLGKSKNISKEARDDKRELQKRRNKLSTEVASIEKRKASFALIKHQQGERHSQFGTCWVTKDTTIKIKKEDLDLYLNNGYIKGRKIILGN